MRSRSRLPGSGWRTKRSMSFFEPTCGRIRRRGGSCSRTSLVTLRSPTSRRTDTTSRTCSSACSRPFTPRSAEHRNERPVWRNGGEGGARAKVRRDRRSLEPADHRRAQWAAREDREDSRRLRLASSRARGRALPRPSWHFPHGVSRSRDRSGSRRHAHRTARRRASARGGRGGRDSDVRARGHAQHGERGERANDSRSNAALARYTPPPNPTTIVSTMTSSSAPSAELHPRIRELLDYLDVHRREFHAAVASVPAKLREVKPGEGRWSVAEVMEHESLIEGRIAGLVT